MPKAGKRENSLRNAGDGYIDLNLPEENSRQLTEGAFALGYGCTAVSHRVVGRISEMDRFTPPRETLAQAGPMPAFERLLRVTSRLSWASEENRTTERKVLSRLTFIAEDHTQTNALLEARDVISSYDIVAIQPMTERAMMQACSVLDVDIICIDAGQRLPFKLRPPLLKNALDRGVHFEICYTSALRGGSSRWNFFNNAQVSAPRLARPAGLRRCTQLPDPRRCSQVSAIRLLLSAVSSPLIATSSIASALGDFGCF